MSLFAATAGAELEPVRVLSSLLRAVAGTQAPPPLGRARRSRMCVQHLLCVGPALGVSHTLSDLTFTAQSPPFLKSGKPGVGFPAEC